MKLIFCFEAVCDSMQCMLYGVDILVFIASHDITVYALPMYNLR
jgi:hypothetical protein